MKQSKLNLLDEQIILDPIGTINKCVEYSAQIGMPTTFKEVRSSFYMMYLGEDAKSGTDYAKRFATATLMDEEEQESLRYAWCEKEEKHQKQKEIFEKDPLWMGKQNGDWVIAIQENLNPDSESLNIPEDARVTSSWKVHFNINDFLKSMFLYVNKSQHGFICKACDFNQDSNKFYGELRIFF